MASYDLSQSNLSIIGYFDKKVVSLGSLGSELLIGGEFTHSTAGYQSLILDHLAKLDVATAVSEISNENKIEVYPNPTSDFIHVQLPDNEIVSQIELSDAKQSQTVYKAQKLSASRNISVAALPSRVYLLRALTNNGWSIAKVVKE